MSSLHIFAPQVYFVVSVNQGAITWWATAMNRHGLLGGLTASLLLLPVGLIGTSRAQGSAAEPPRSTDELVRLAHEAELQGDNAERDLWVQRALKQNSDHASARALAGHLRDDRRWASFEDYTAGHADSTLLQRYHDYRFHCFQQMPAEQAHIAMARWCRQQHLPERERFHWLMVVQRTPNQPEALAALDLIWNDGRLWTQEELQQFRDQQRKQQQWSERIAALVKRIEQHPDTPSARKAMEELRGIDDPAAIEGILEEMSSRSEALRLEAIAILSQWKHPEATGGLVSLALGRFPFPAACEEAKEQLRRRPFAETAPFLLGLLTWPVQLEQELLSGPYGLEYASRMTTEGPNARYVREELRIMTYRPGTAIEVAYSPQCLRSMQQRQAADTARYQQQMERNKGRIERAKLRSISLNAVVADLLSELSGENVPADPQACIDWWCDYNEVTRSGEKPLLRSAPRIGFEIDGYEYRTLIRSTSCFPRGTPVWTESGLRPIETLQPGDQVLSQDPDSGDLCFKSVLTTTEREPTPIVRIRANGENVSATKGHPFWHTGNGWRMAKFLNTGDLLHGLHGSWPIESVEELPPQAAFNLIVDGYGTYFVGQTGLLVHDNTFRQPTTALLPGYHAPGQ